MKNIPGLIRGKVIGDHFYARVEGGYNIRKFVDLIGRKFKIDNVGGDESFIAELEDILVVIMKDTFEPDYGFFSVKKLGWKQAIDARDELVITYDFFVPDGYVLVYRVLERAVD